MSAIVDIEAARARLAAIDAEREPLLALIRAAEAYEGVVGKSLFESGSITIRQRAKPATSGRAAPMMAITEAAVTPLLELCGPTSTADLVQMLRGKAELGLTVENANNILSARLSNSRLFDGRRGLGWWFKDRPWPGEEPARLEYASGHEQP